MYSVSLLIKCHITKHIYKNSGMTWEEVLNYIQKRNRLLLYARNWTVRLLRPAQKEQYPHKYKQMGPS